MLRIRLGSNDEVQYDTTEQFTAAVRAGAVRADATIFHAKSERWLPVSSHPAFRLAAASMKLPTPAVNAKSRVGTGVTTLVAPAPHYAEPRRQASRGAEGLGRPDDARSDYLILGLATTLVLIMTALALLRPVTYTPETDGPTREASIGVAWAQSYLPGTLEIHHAAREASMVNALSDRLHRLRPPAPLLPAAIDSPEILDQAMIRIREARDTIAAFRRRAAGVDRVYFDSTGRVGQTDAAPLAPLLGEPDSSYALAQALTALLVAERGHYRYSGDGVGFERAVAGAEYGRLLGEFNAAVRKLKSNPRFSMLPPPLPDLPAAAPHS
jgi:hypothetical protein